MPVEGFRIQIGSRRLGWSPSCLSGYNMTSRVLAPEGRKGSPYILLSSCNTLSCGWPSVSEARLSAGSYLLVSLVAGA